MGRLAHNTIDLLREIWKEWNEDRGAGLSAEIAFYGILSLFPALLSVTGFLGLLQDLTGGDVADRAKSHVLSFMQDVFTDKADDTIEAVRQLFDESSPGVFTFGLVAALWALSRGFAALIRALDVAYNVEHADMRSWIRIRLTGLLMGLASVAVAVLMLGALILGPLFGTGGELAERIGAGAVFATFWDWVRLPAMGVALIAWATALFHLGPSPHHTRWRWDLPGAVTTAVLAVVSSFAMRIYLAVAAGSNQVFGILGGALVVLLWLYLIGASLIIGAEVNAVLAKRWQEDSGVDSPTEPTDEVPRVGGVTAVEQDAHDR